MKTLETLNAWSFRHAGKLLSIGLTVAFLSVALLGCKTAVEKQQAAQKKVNDAKAAIALNETKVVERASGMVYATGVALDRVTNPPPAVLVARDLNERAMLALGPPSYAEALVLRKMVADLLSTNELIRVQGEEALILKDGEISKLNREKVEAESKLEKAEDRRDADYQASAVKAEHWEKLMGWVHKILWILGIGVGAIIGINIAAIAYPPLMPIAAIVNKLTGGIFGGLGAVVFRLMPHAKASAGVVSADEHDAVIEDKEKKETTLTHLVEAIEDFRTKDPAGFAEHMKGRLQSETTKETSRPVINEIKTKLGYV